MEAAFLQAFRLWVSFAGKLRLPIKAKAAL
jgi:hypothetical protein